MDSLRDIAIKHRTDKAGGNDLPGNHEYCDAYEFFLASKKDRHFMLIEIGVGGYEYLDRGGESLRMWREYFTNAEIHGVDIHPKSINIPGVDIHIGRQDNPEFWQNFLLYRDAPEVIIDDASHINPLTLKTFNILWPMLAAGGIYIIEDVHTSYWHDHGYEGGWGTDNVMEYFTHQAHVLNIEEWIGKTIRPVGYQPVTDIESIHFFKEIIFIRKKL